MPNKFERLTTYKTEDVLQHVPVLSSLPENTKPHTIRKDFNGNMVKMCSQRYYTFQKSLFCAHCNIEGQFMAMERHIDKKGKPLSNSFHFNLYAIDNNGKEVLMTKDHIIPRFKGGRDVLKNYQTMCEICNSAKSALNEDKAILAAQKRLAITN